MSFVTSKALKVAFEDFKSESEKNLPTKVSLLENDVNYVTNLDTYTKELINELLDNTSDSINENLDSIIIDEIDLYFIEQDIDSTLNNLSSSIINHEYPISKEAADSIVNKLLIAEKSSRKIFIKYGLGFAECLISTLDPESEESWCSYHIIAFLGRYSYALYFYTLGEFKNKPFVLVDPGDYEDWFNAKQLLKNLRYGKVDGKGLSTNDFTNELKEKLLSLVNYDDSDVREYINEVSERLNTLIKNDNVDLVIDTFNEIEDFLKGISNKETLLGLLLEMKDLIVDYCRNTYVSRSTTENIGGVKTFTNYTKFTYPIMFKAEDAEDSVYLSPSSDGSLHINTHNNWTYTGNIGLITTDGKLVMKAFIKDGGTSNQILKADGSVDDTIYIPKTGLSDNDAIFNVKQTNSSSTASFGINFLEADNTDRASILQKGNYGNLELTSKYGNINFITSTEERELLYNNKKVWHEDNDGADSGLDADLLDGVQGARFNYNHTVFQFLTSSNKANITTNQFLTKLASLGAFNRVVWVSNTTWQYAYNDIITDTDCGDIELAGCIIEVFTTDPTSDLTTIPELFKIRITTAPQSAATGLPNSIFIYRNHGSGYNPNWNRLVNNTTIVERADKLTLNILTNENLNNLRPVSFTIYRANSNTCSNKPANVEGFNLVAYRTADNYYVQIMYTVTLGDFRRTYNTNGIWSDWKRMLTEDDLTDIKNRLTALENK